MKKVCLGFLLFLSFGGLSAQTLFTYGKFAVDKDEFLKAYNKNKSNVEDKEKALREYLDLYINFKLKVKDAEKMQLDTLPQLKADQESFRQQVAENFLTDEQERKRLMEEAFKRSQKDLHIWHYAITSDNDSNLAKSEAKKLFEALNESKNNVDDLISEIRTKGLAVKNRDLGFITVFTVPYLLENSIYSLKKGQVSAPIRNKNTWHIFRLIEEREAAGNWKIAQIMLAIPPDADATIKAVLKKRADSLLNLLKAGQDFALLAKAYSEDKLTFQNGGEMPEFGTGKYDKEFESAVFQLQQDGDLTSFSTAYGFHIVKRISRSPVVNDPNDATALYALRQKLQADARIQIAREKLAKKMMPVCGIKRVSAVSDAELKRFMDSALSDPGGENDQRFAIYDKAVLEFKKARQTGADWIRYVRYTQPKADVDVKELINQYMYWATLEYYKNHLEEFDADFRYQMQEFRDGNMLFEAMERNVWGKAALDSVGLKAYYEANKTNYKWAPSGNMILVNTTTKENAEWALNALKSGMPWREITADNEEIQMDSSRFELSQIASAMTADVSSLPALSPISENPDQTYSFVQILNTYPGDQQRNFEDARGLAINDYQSVLEKEWIASLRKKYPIKVNETVFKKLLQQ